MAQGDASSIDTMPSRPQPPFEAILRRTLAAVRDDEPAEESPAAPIRSAPWYVPETAALEGRTNDVAGFADRYEAPAEAPTVLSEEPVTPRSTDPDEISRELDLAGCADLAALRQCRRRFAATDHPDLVDARLRENATARMMTANRLIDEEIRRRVRLTS